MTRVVAKVCRPTEAMKLHSRVLQLVALVFKKCLHVLRKINISIPEL